MSFVMVSKSEVHEKVLHFIGLDGRAGTVDAICDYVSSFGILFWTEEECHKIHEGIHNIELDIDVDKFVEQITDTLIEMIAHHQSKPWTEEDLELYDPK